MKPGSGVILYGPPAAGKDTVTAALVALSHRYVHYQRMKVGSGRTDGYRLIDMPELTRLRSAGRIVWENERYGALYAVERESLTELAGSCIPVVHLGQLEAVSAVKAATPSVEWIEVHLWCPRDVAIRRLRERRTGDLSARLRAWDDTRALPNSQLMIDTARTSAADAARMIHVCVTSAGATECGG